MGYDWQEHDGLMTVMIDGKMPLPLAYIVTRDAPPWLVEPLRGETREFDSLEAAQLALILSFNSGDTK